MLHKLLILGVIVVFITSCEFRKHKIVKDFDSLQKEVIFEDSLLSIRALMPVTESSVWFAANEGRVGYITDKTPKLATIIYESYKLEFRAISGIENAIFVLSAGNPGIMYRIGVEGETATFIEDVYEERGEGVFYNSMKFWNTMEGIAVGDPVDNCFSVLITRDGGDTWKKVSCDNLPEALEGEVNFAASNSNIALYNNHSWFVTGGSASRIYYSPDKGETWKAIDTPMLSGSPSSGIHSVDFYNEKIGVIAGGDHNHMAENVANKAITFDGGKTWSLFSDKRNPGYISSVKFVPGGHGKTIVGVGESGVYFYNQNKDAWDKLSNDSFHAIEFVNDSVAFASGKGRIVKLVFKEAH